MTILFAYDGSAGADAAIAAAGSLLTRQDGGAVSAAVVDLGGDRDRATDDRAGWYGKSP